MARRILGLTVFFLATGFLIPTPAQGQKAPTGPEIDSDKLTPGTFVGRLKGAVSPGSDFDLMIEVPRIEINQKALQGNRNQNQVRQMVQAQQQIARAQQQMQRAKNPQEQARAMQQMQRTMQQLQQNQLRQAIQQQRASNNAVKVVKDTKEISFYASADVIVRLANPPISFDEKGNLQTLTPQLLRELKGSNPQLPGYEGKPEDLKSGAVVQVVLKRAVVDPKNPAPPENRNVVTMIVIQKEGSDTPGRGKK